MSLSVKGSTFCLCFFIISQPAAAEPSMHWSAGADAVFIISKYDIHDTCSVEKPCLRPILVDCDEMGVPPDLAENSSWTKGRKNSKKGWSCPSCEASCHIMHCHINPLGCLNKTHPVVSDTASLSTSKALKVSSQVYIWVLSSNMNTKVLSVEAEV